MAKLIMLTETSEYMMSFVIVTEKNNCIVIDGGRPLDMPLLKETLDGRHISAWILTHAHDDHISGLVDELARDGGADFDIEGIYYNFPDLDALSRIEDVPDLDYFRQEISEMLPAFAEVRHTVADREHIVHRGDRLEIDEIKIEFLYTYHEGLYANVINDSSLVFRLETERTSVLFLGDLGPDGGDILFRESRDRLRSDIVQMAHHGHMNVSMEVYAAISPRICLWCAPLFLYNEPEFPDYLADAERAMRMRRMRMYGSRVTRDWMDRLGVREHYVSGNGTQVLEI